MAAYLESLAALADDQRFDVIAPGHGFLIEQPQRLLRALIRHRQLREAKVQAALQAAGPATLDELVLRVYDDVGVERHPIARRSLLAHLLHLKVQGRAGDIEGRWSLDYST
jgi:hypothetical protein